MNLNIWHDKGMTVKQYIDEMKVNREGLLTVYQGFQVPQADRTAWQSLRDQQLKMVVLTADWCGDAMLCMPVMIRIAEEAGISLRCLNRDDHLDLMDQYLTNGTSRSIPIFILLNEAGEEIAVWGPRAPQVQELVTEMRNALPPAEDPSFQEEQKKMYRGFKERLVQDEKLWDVVYNSMKDRLQA
ncbi:thioredoxin family protein [Mechercharimyces sp. CAU 1602]|uniref:thioredoxin family protein n=1 Tax=Mechercharimyces sp. CAU 1602 TaxID=2973933 RepID=UPI0021613755|nr:thioredoxin family protein [Mechercharimyces sp. CAU 1602]MCS1352131.1 thioredoxin family protein [Mechercharimyces sp. CAU 1602]